MTQLSFINEIGLYAKGWYAEHDSPEPKNEYAELKKVMGVLCCMDAEYVSNEGVFLTVLEVLQYLATKRNPNGDSRCMNDVFKDVFFRKPLFPDSKEASQPIDVKILKEMLGEIRQFECKYFPDPAMPFNEKIGALFPPLPEHMVKLQAEWKSRVELASAIKDIQEVNALRAEGKIP